MKGSEYDFHLFVEHRNKAKQKQQNSMRLINSEKWLVVTKGKGNGQAVGGRGGRDIWNTVMYIWLQTKKKEQIEEIK